MALFREPLNTLTHLLGLFFSILGSALLLRLVPEWFSLEAISAIVYSLGLILLYGASSCYHAYQGNDQAIERWRIVDHSMIYILIAGTYTPICLLVLQSTLGHGLLLSIWISSLIGIGLKISSVRVPRWFYTGIYLVLGWAAVIVIVPLYHTLPFFAMALLFGGGLSYTFGAVIYGRKSPSLHIGIFYFHEIFHLFILLGSLLHFLLIYFYVFS